jgi:hypothetical protein
MMAMSKYIGGCFLFVFLGMIVSCSQGDNSSKLIELTLEYSSYPSEWFSIYSKGDSNYFEYKKKRVELDSQYRIKHDRYIYRKSIRKHSDTSLFTIKIFKTDSVFNSDSYFTSDSVNNRIVVMETNRTKWFLIDSVVVSNLICSFKTTVRNEDIRKAIGFAEYLTSMQQTKTSPCLDGLTTTLNYTTNNILYSYRHDCNYMDNDKLRELVQLCNELKLKNEKPN